MTQDAHHTETANFNMTDFLFEQLSFIASFDPNYPVTAREAAKFFKGSTIPQAEAIAHRIIMELVEDGRMVAAQDKIYTYGDWLPYYVLIQRADSPPSAS